MYKKKIKILFLLLCCLLLSTSFNFQTFAQNSVPKMVLLFTNNPFENVEVSIEVLGNTSGVTDFVLLNGQYNAQDNDDYSTLVNNLCEYAQEVLKKCPNAKLWLGTPSISSKTSVSKIYSYYDSFYDFIFKLEQQMGDNWSSVAGIYMNCEAIYGTPITSMSNPTIKLMNDLSYKVHTAYNKKFLWIPYYETKYRENEKIAYVADRTTIFDYILLQPQYYFKGDAGNFLEPVYKSVINQNIYDTNGNRIFKRESYAKAVIGFEMEITQAVNWNSTGVEPYLSRYNAYVNTFNSIKHDYPFAYYTGFEIRNPQIHKFITDSNYPY